MRQNYPSENAGEYGVTCSLGQMNREQMVEAAKLGAYLEFVSGFARGPRAAETTKEYVEAIRAVGVEQSFVSRPGPVDDAVSSRRSCDGSEGATRQRIHRTRTGRTLQGKPGTNSWSSGDGHTLATSSTGTNAPRYRAGRPKLAGRAITTASSPAASRRPCCGCARPSPTNN